MATSISSKDKPPPLPLSDTLRDLALLRAASVDLSHVLPTPVAADTDTEMVQRSYEFVREARAVLRLHHRDAVGAQGERVERVREGMEELLRVVSEGTSGKE